MAAGSEYQPGFRPYLVERITHARSPGSQRRALGRMELRVERQSPRNPESPFFGTQTDSSGRAALEAAFLWCSSSGASIPRRLFAGASLRGIRWRAFRDDISQRIRHKFKRAFYRLTTPPPTS